MHADAVSKQQNLKTGLKKKRLVPQRGRGQLEHVPNAANQQSALPRYGTREFYRKISRLHSAGNRHALAAVAR